MREEDVMDDVVDRRGGRGRLGSKVSKRSRGRFEAAPEEEEIEEQ